MFPCSQTQCGRLEVVSRWKKDFSKYEKDIAMLEFELEILSSVSIGELEVVVTKFVAFTIKERDNGHPILDENLLNA